MNTAPFRSLLRRRSTWIVLALLVVICSVLLSFQGPRCCLYGWLRFEPTYRWLPASYWRMVFLENLRPPPPRVKGQTSLLDLVQDAWQVSYQRSWSPAAQARHLRQRDPRLVALARYFLHDPDDQVHWLAIGLIGQMGDDDAREFLPNLVEFLDSPNYRTRSLAIHVLGEMGPAADSALPRLKRMFTEEPRDEQKLMVARAILHMDRNDQESMVYLVELLKRGKDRKSRDPYLIRCAAHHLAWLKPPPKEVLPILLELARDDDPQLAQSAFMAIMRIDPAVAKREGLEEK